MSLLPLSRPPGPRRRRLRGMSPHHPGIAWGGGGGGASPSGQPPEEIVPSSSPFLCGRGRVASCGSEAEEAPGRARAFGRPVRWRPRRPATATRPRDGRAGCQEPPAGRFYIVPPPPELRRGLQEDYDSATGPEAELSETGYAGGDSPGDTEAWGRPAVCGDWFSRFLRRVTVAALQIGALGRPGRVDQHLPVPLRPWRRTGRTLPGPARRGGQGEGLPCPERLDSDSAVRPPPGSPSGAFASPSAPLRRWGPARTVAWRSAEGAAGSGPSGSL